MSFSDGNSFGGFAANTAGSGSSQQPFPGTGMNPGAYPGFPLPMYPPQFPMALPMMPYPPAGIYGPPTGKHTAVYLQL
jgi:hypothetical protein